MLSDSQSTPEVVETQRDQSIEPKRIPMRLRNLKSSLNNTFGPMLVGFNQRYKTGLLHMNILFIMAIYNFVFFQASEGREIYYFFPLLMGVSGFITQYWKIKTRTRIYLGNTFILLGFFWDIFVSVTYIFGPDGYYDLETIPTLTLDFLGCIIAAFWLANRERFEEETKEKVESLLENKDPEEF